MMFDAIKMAWKQATTEGDNLTSCPVRLGSFVTGLVYHIGAAWMVLGQSTHLDMTIMGAYVQHMATLIGTAAAAIGAKSVLKGDAQ